MRATHLTWTLALAMQASGFDGTVVSHESGILSDNGWSCIVRNLSDRHEAPGHVQVNRAVSWRMSMTRSMSGSTACCDDSRRRRCGPRAHLFRCRFYATYQPSPDFSDERRQAMKMHVGSRSANRIRENIVTVSATCWLIGRLNLTGRYWRKERASPVCSVVK